mmetsp:Transcript_1372/g.3008  ORF Transcript_1372/g.3008 Transcript_1372/m.3008 type:complete len:130 (-) Transcript_1372:127-516(-)
MLGFPSLITLRLLCPCRKANGGQSASWLEELSQLLVEVSDRVRRNVARAPLAGQHITLKTFKHHNDGAEFWVLHFIILSPDIRDCVYQFADRIESAVLLWIRESGANVAPNRDEHISAQESGCDGRLER